jgi:hypothetical protein
MSTTPGGTTISWSESSMSSSTSQSWERISSVQDRGSPPHRGLLDGTPAAQGRRERQPAGVDAGAASTEEDETEEEAWRLRTGLGGVTTRRWQRWQSGGVEAGAACWLPAGASVAPGSFPSGALAPVGGLGPRMRRQIRCSAANSRVSRARKQPGREHRTQGGSPSAATPQDSTAHPSRLMLCRSALVSSAPAPSLCCVDWTMPGRLLWAVIDRGWV